MHKTLKFKIIITAFLTVAIIMSISVWRHVKGTEAIILNNQKEKAVLFSERIEHGLMVLMLKNNCRDLQLMLEGMVKEFTELKEIRIFLPDTGTI